MKIPLPALPFLAPISSAPGAFIINMGEVGSDVLVLGSGQINLTGATSGSGGTTSISQMGPNIARFISTPASNSPRDDYLFVTRPISFGSGIDTFTGLGTGDLFSIIGNNLGLPAGYVSQDPLSFSLTFPNTDLATVGANIGSYEWTLPNDTITLNVGATIPEPSSVMLIVSMAGFGLLRSRRRK